MNPLFTGCWLLTAGYWDTSAAGRRVLSSVADFRIDRKKKYPLHEILMIAVCAMLDGAKVPTFGALRAKCLNSQQPAASVQWEADGDALITGRCAVGCWLFEHFGRRPLRARREDLAENLATLRHVVLNVLRLDKSVFGGISVKRKELAWDDDKLLGLMLAA